MDGVTDQLEAGSKAAAKQPSRWVDLYLAVLFAGLCGSGMRLLHSTAVWTLADWLINYQGGFVRRGLPGEIAFHLGPLLHVALPAIVLGMALLAYVLVFLSVRALAGRVTWNIWMVAAFVSPVAVAYPFVSTSGYHKEALFFAAFGALLWRLLVLSRRAKDASWKESLALALAGTAGVLSHELFAIYAPYLLAAVYLATPKWRDVLRVIALPALAIGATFALVLTHPGTPQTARAVCASLGPGQEGMCRGSIEYLGRTRAEARGDVLESMDEYHYLRLLPPLTLLGMLPVAGGLFALRRSGMTPAMWWTLAGCSATAWGLSVPLFRYAADWGRWIEIHLFSAFLLLLFANALFAKTPAARTVWWISQSRWRSLLMTALLLVYATCWSLPGTTDIPKGGYVSMFGRVALRHLHHAR